MTRDCERDEETLFKVVITPPEKTPVTMILKPKFGAHGR